MILLNNSSHPPFRALLTERPWGYYGLYSDNEPCTCKILYIKKNEMLSLQYHFNRDQFYMSLDPGFTVQYSNRPLPEDILNNPDDNSRIAAMNDFLQKYLITCEVKEGDMFGFHRGVVHRASYAGDREFGRVLDIAFGENDENDIVRINDKYGRVL